MAAKRLGDLIVAGALLPLALPLIAVAALAVRLTSRGPAFYWGIRVGLHERPFPICKLRTMVGNADQIGLWWTAADDPRITRVGRFLRHTSIDELPQLFNVLRGDMSMVGPRPAAIEQLAEYMPEQRRWRASVRPGLTGLAQVSGRSALEGLSQIELDVWYAQHVSLTLDIAIMVRTIPAVLLRRGVN